MKRAAGADADTVADSVDKSDKAVTKSALGLALQATIDDNYPCRDPLKMLCWKWNSRMGILSNEYGYFVR
jgi:hypothetical protein